MSFNDTVRAVARRAGYKIVRDKKVGDAMALLVWHAQQRGVQTVLDIGANSGQTGDDLRRLGWTGRVVSFEPLPEMHSLLTANAASDPNWIVAPPMALGPEESVATINVSANFASSSLLEIEQRTVDVAPETTMVNAIDVRVAALDSVMDAEWAAPLAIKIDTQGFEGAVLDGAEETLKRTQVIAVEMSLTPVYTGGIDFLTLYQRLVGYGFRCIAITECFADHQKNEVLQVDGVFVRA